MTGSRTNRNAPNDDTEQATKSENGRERSGQAIPPQEDVSNDKYRSQNHKFTEQEHRTGLRRADNHYSWREVYRACHVGVGVDD